ncbi:hypothetical protein L916_11202 [Phytophthora nicotianae]|uniref:Uncharacterized protein n=1 Tax=Phytophthora nicotianae TaxID=4792 RepID=W2IRQ4_PHYNI|nr:hypothetical protein L916_11202 [Phytophthora nicotianae]
MSKLDRAVYDQSMTLDVSESVTLAEYFWIGGSGQDLRCKTKTLTKPIVGQNWQVQKTIGWPQFVCAIVGSIQYLQVAADLCLDNQRSTVEHPARLRKQLQLHNVPPQLRVYDFDLDSKGRHRS